MHKLEIKIKLQFPACCTVFNYNIIINMLYFKIPYKSKIKFL